MIESTGSPECLRNTMICVIANEPLVIPASFNTIFGRETVAIINASDLLKILDLIPLWKKLKELPAKVEALEAKVADLERRGLPPAPAGKRCPFCGQNNFFVVKSEPDPIFGPLGGKKRTYRCSSCGQEEETVDTKG